MRAALFLTATCCFSVTAIAADYPAMNDPDFAPALRGPIVPAGPAPVLQAAPNVARSSWTGLYIGLNAGYGGGYDSYRLSPLDGAENPSGTLTVHSSGAIGGAQVGYTQWLGGAVIGVEADFDGSTISGGAHGYADQASVISGGSRFNYIGTVRGRLGYAFGPVLVYGTGGFAYAGTTSNLTINDYVSASASRMHMGYAFGGGVEFALAENVTLRTEFIHADFDKAQLTESNHYDAQLTHRPSVNLIRAGVNLRFPTLVPTSLAPVVARY